MSQVFAPLSQVQLETIVPGTCVLYTHSKDLQGGGTWSAVVVEVNHRRRLRYGSWAVIRFDGVVVPAACAHGVKGVQPQTNTLDVDFDKLVVRVPEAGDDAKRAVWAAKVMAHDARATADKLAAHAATMESYMHLHAGMSVTWKQLTGMGWGPQPDSYALYSGTIVSIDLHKLMAQVSRAESPSDYSVSLAGLTVV
jgi:hypothetical protein